MQAETPSAAEACRHSIYNADCDSCNERDPESDDWRIIRPDDHVPASSEEEP